MAQLTVKERKFVTEYRKHGIGSKAATDAGYAEKSAAVTASKLLKKPNIAAEIARRDAKSEKNVELTVELVRTAVAKMLTYDLADICTNDGKLKPLNEIPEDARQAIVAVNDKGFKLQSRLPAAELGAKLLGMVKDQQVQQQAIQITIGPPPERHETAPSAGQLRPEWE